MPPDDNVQQAVPDHLSDLRIRPAANTGDDTAALQQRTMQQAQAALPQPKITPPWQEEPELPGSDPLSQAYSKAKNFISEHEDKLSAKYLAPFRQGLDNMADDLQQAGETGHTKTGGQLTGPTRALASGVGTLMKQVPVGRNVKETAQALITPPELGPFEGLRARPVQKAYKRQASYAKNTALPQGAENFKAENLKPGQDTQTAYANSPERKAYQEKVKQEFLSPATSVPAGQKPKIIVLGGGTASGKTTATRGLMRRNRNSVRIDADEIKTRIPEYEQLKATDPQNAAVRVHEESKDISKSVLDQAVKERKNIILDATTSSNAQVDKIKDLKKQGYHVHAVFVDVPVDTAIKRANDRALNSVDPINKGRFIPEDIIRENHTGAAQSFFNLKDHADDVELLDNSGPKPKKVYQRFGNQPEKVYNEQKYGKYQEKARGSDLSAGPQQSTGTNAGGTETVQGRVETGTRVGPPAPRNRLARVSNASAQAAKPTAKPDDTGSKPGKTAAQAGVNPEATKSSDSPEAPPGSRWEGDRGAIPGEPGWTLDKGKAAIIEHESPDKPGYSTYEARLDGGKSLGHYSTVKEAAAAAENAVPGKRDRIRAASKLGKQ